MTLVAIKPLKHMGKTYKPGQVLDPPPDATLARRLLDGRFVRDSETPMDQRPPGTGRGGPTKRRQGAPRPSDKET